MRIIDDVREISSIFDGPWSARVGEAGVTSIIPYEENGEMAAVTWFAVYRGNNIWLRVRATGVQYKRDCEWDTPLTPTLHSGG